MRKTFLFLGICFFIIAIAFTATLIVSSVELDYSENHYEVTYKRPTSDTTLGRLDSGYGCGDMECKYCNGKKNQTIYSNFVFYRTMNSLKTASIIILPITGGLSIASFVAFVLIKYQKKDKDK